MPALIGKRTMMIWADMAVNESEVDLRLYHLFDHFYRVMFSVGDMVLTGFVVLDELNGLADFVVRK
jgi:hypothetical protein